jgi:hypothetical protein
MLKTGTNLLDDEVLGGSLADRRTLLGELNWFCNYEIVNIAALFLGFSQRSQTQLLGQLSLWISSKGFSDRYKHIKDFCYNL